jgi:peroxiredoxin
MKITPMKTIHLLTSLLFFGASHLLFAEGPGYSIKVKIKGLSNTKCFLGNYYGDKQYVKDTAKVDGNGRVIFEGKEKLPGGIYLIITPDKKYFEALVTENQNFSMETDTLDFVQHMKIKGSEDNILFYSYLNFISEKSKEIEPLRKEYEKVKNNKDSASVLRKKMSAIDHDVKEYKIKFMKDHPGAFLSQIFKASSEPEIPEAPKLPNGKIDSTFAYRYYKTHFFDNIDFSDDRLIRTPIFHNKIEQYIKNLTYQIPDSIDVAADYLVKKASASKELFKYVVWYITNAYETSNIMGMDAVFVHMVENYYTPEKAVWLDKTQLFKITERAKKLKPILLGKVAPSIILKDTSGAVHSLYNIKAKYTVLFFWDPDCGHCQKSIPKLIEFYDKFKSKDVALVAVCTEVEEDKWKKFIKEKKLTFLNLGDPKLQSNFRYEYDISSTPQIFLLDHAKVIIAKKLDVEQLTDFMENHLKIK